MVSDAEIWFEESRVELNILIYPLLLSLSLTIHPLSPLCSYHSNCFHLIFLFLSPLLLFLSPACDHNNASLRHSGNKPGPPAFLCTSPLVSTKPIKGWLNYSCCVPPTPESHSTGLRVGRAWARCNGTLGWGIRTTEDPVFLLSLTPIPKPSRHYFIVLTEMKKWWW